jgi:hypothetical protein
MLEQIRRCVESTLAGAERDSIDLGRFLCLDLSRGRIDGCCCLFFDRRGAGPVVVAKATRSPARKAVYALELDNLRALEAAGLNATGRTTPRPLGSREEDGVLVTLQSALPGRLMRNLPARELFAAARLGQTSERVCSWLGRLQQAYGVRRQTVDVGIYETTVLALVRRIERRYRVGPEERMWLDRRFDSERRLLGLELPWTVAHGDFCTANLVVQERGIGAFDWEHALVHSLPLYDLFFFFSSTRFPFRGWRGESSYAASFAEVYWGASHVSAELGRRVARACEETPIPRDAVGDLLVLALLVRADRKYDAFVAAAGLDDRPPPADDDEAGKRKVWEALREMERDAPLFWCREGVLESLRHIARHDLPRL